MAVLSSTGIFEFDRFRLDRRGLFRRDEEAALVPVETGSRALDVLRVLLERPGDLVSRDEIMAAAWPGIVVEDNNLTIQIAALRRVLDEDHANGSCIQTVPRRGYRFVAPVTRVEPAGTGNGIGGRTAEREQTEVIGAQGEKHRVARSISRARYSLWSGAAAAAIGALILMAAVGSSSIRWPWDPPRAPRLSIVVLPFANLSGDPAQQYFADGITEDVTTDLSRIVDMFVISRNTAATYRKKPADTKRIGRELGVRYVMDGSVQRSGTQVRVTAQLIDAETDKHLWADRFERDIGDLFTLQNEITRQIAVALGFEMIAAENAKPSDNLDAVDFILRGRAKMLNPPARHNFAEMISLYDRAVALDPGSVVANSYLATALLGRVLNGMSDTAPADIERAEGLVNRALAISPRNPHAHLAKGFLLRAQNRVEEAIPEYEIAVASNRNWLLAIATLAWCKFQTGSLDDAIPLHEQAIRLSPRDNLIGVWYQRIGMVHLLKSRTDEAISWLEKARNANPLHPQPHPWLAAAYALKGDTERAAAELAETRRLASDDRYATIARLKAAGYYGVPKIRALYEDTFSPVCAKPECRTSEGR
ncbi:MAG: winged helix-turn-helix domain-containing protein, partial [Pseudolabrys sp.]|nr:winged helix-turn-helix domain-containing protein [Pseudolabrys sp.]